MTMKTLILTTAAALALAGCSGQPGPFEGFDRESGSQIDNGSFGNATMNNQLAQTGQADFAVSLGQRFAAEVDTTINFAFNSATLDGEAQATLQRQADWIKQFPEIRFKVFGHTDAVGSQAYNQGLGLQRANAVVAYLSSQGISRSRLEALVSYGETRPVIATPNMERQNRRTVTEVSGFVQNHPSVLNGKYAEVIFREYVASAVPQATTSDNGGGQVAPTGE